MRNLPLWFCDHVFFIIVKGVDYPCIIHDINKSEAIHLLGDSMLEDFGNI